MPRPPRIQLANGLYHVTARGVAEYALFCDQGDRRLFIDLLRTTIRRCQWECHAYCLMTTHYHLLVQTRAPNLAAGMHFLNGRYAQLFNERYGRLGHLFFRRYAATMIGSEEQLAQAWQYVLDNPVRAGLCSRAEDWPWSGSFTDPPCPARTCRGPGPGHVHWGRDR